MSDDDDYVNIVLDIGSCVCKAGFAGDDAPRCMFSSAIGKPRHQGIMIGLGNKDTFVGSEAQARRAVLSLDYPIKRGVIKDWDVMQKVWENFYYNELRAAPEEHPVLVTEPPLNPKVNREKMTEIFFETLSVPGFYVAIPAVLSCYASGRGSAMMLDVGHGVSHVLPIYEGYTLPHVIDRFNLGGQDVTDYLGRLIQGRGYNLDTTAEQEVLREMKEEVCYSAQDYHKEMRDAECYTDKEVRYELPDGNKVTVGTERFQAAEALFEPRLMIGMDCPGVHEKVSSAIMKCDMDMRRHLYCNVVVSGATTLLPGFSDRLQSELGKLFPPNKRTKVVGSEQKVSVWIGGSILASLSTFQQMWIKKEDYDESGPSIAHRKCF